MLLNPEISLIMDTAVKGTMKTIRREGYAHPFLYLFNYDKPLIVETENPIVIFVDNREEPQNDNVYLTIIALKLGTDEAEIELNKLAKELVKKYNPIAVGFTATGFYKEYAGGEENLPDTLDTRIDPDSARVMFVNCFYKEAASTAYRIVPYMLRGEIKNAADDAEEKYDVTFVNAPWRFPYKETTLPFEDPYERRPV